MHACGRWQQMFHLLSSTPSGQAEECTALLLFVDATRDCCTCAATPALPAWPHSHPVPAHPLALLFAQLPAAPARWFNFRMTNVAGQELTLHINNAGQCSFPAAWQGYQACASYDLEHGSDSGVLTIQHTPRCDAVQYAYFAPYTYNRHRQLIARTQAKPGVKLLMLGETLDGHDLNLLQLGTPGPGKPNVWIIARQHPGESMAEWFADGLLERLTNQHDAISRHLLRDACVYVMPNVNPDGTWRGHLRTNAAGVNLNRAWAKPCKEDSPEVFHLLRVMEEKGVDMLVDVHGDEELPYCFIAGSEGIPGWSDRLKGLQDAFCTAYQRSSPDFQTKFGYGVDAPGEANMTICSNQVAQRFDCLAVTLEMPFKDTADHPDAVQGWSPERARLFGAALLPAVYEVLPSLRPQ
ncbi:peptidase M14, carboxypeptidase A [Scenedesmus sp. NREL 46B-D3]|nr:peptidase M14, carboxypeptidase A [Scenedesmus sp. NREL 46B-D3]